MTGSARVAWSASCSAYDTAVRAVVTGGAGFIGSHVAEALVARGDEVHVLDNLSTGRREKVPGGTEFHEGDIRSDTAALFADVRPELCFHLAAQADVRVSVERPDYDADVNVLGTLRVLEAARERGTKIVFSSTGGAIYGECDGPAAETADRQPISPYGISKLAGEEYIGGWNRLFGSSHVSLRFANVYGARQEASLEGGVIAIFLERMKEGRPTQIFGDGKQTRDFIYVSDVVDAALAAAGHDGGVFNVGTGVETSVLELHALCRAATAVDRPPEHGPPRAGDVVRSVIDPALAARDLGWQPAHDLSAGLAETWAWVSAH
jgi:UDP-glucose 4-epimerase